jgi:hypothetical protein
MKVHGRRGMMPEKKDDALRKALEAMMHKQTLERLTKALEGRVLRRTVSNVGGGVSGVFSSSETKYGLFLYEDGTFRFEITEFTSVSSGGYSVPSEEKRSGEGMWAIEMIEEKPALVLKQEGSIVRWWHTEDGGSGVQYLNGERWDRYLIRK